MLELTTCPECGAPAEVKWRDDVASTDGPVALQKILCVRRHWFLMPATACPEYVDEPAEEPVERTAGNHRGAASP